MKRILIADDDESIRWVLRKTVTGMGFAVDLAEDGEQALALLGKNAYAAAFVDVRMPGMEGIEVLERVEARVERAATSGRRTAVMMMKRVGDLRASTRSSTSIPSMPGIRMSTKAAAYVFFPSRARAWSPSSARSAA
ncbi:MAG TPA: response regulator, partial [Terriglobales bacterium]|nr:response regulator [Terriglobales bacterium]